MRTDTKQKLALRVLSTATFLAMVSSIATAAFADTYYLENGDITVDAKEDGAWWVQDLSAALPATLFGDLRRSMRRSVQKNDLHGGNPQNIRYIRGFAGQRLCQKTLQQSVDLSQAAQSRRCQQTHGI